MTEPQKKKRPWRFLPGAIGEDVGLALALAALVAVFSLMTDHFFTLTTFRVIANQIPDFIIVAAAVTFVLIIGGIDLSVGSVLALSAAVLGVAMVRWHWPLPLAALACLATGFLCGMANGLIATQWRLPSFIVTLGMLEAARGGAYLITHSQTQYIGSQVESISEGAAFGLSPPFFLAILIVAAGQIVLTRTIFGRYMLAIGANEEAVRLSGINPRPVKVAVFAISGLMAALAAIIQTSRLASVDPNAGAGFELQVIAAVVIGGTSLMGGRGSVVRSLIGVLVIAVLGSGLAQTGVQEPAKRLITGCVMVAAVILDYYRQRWKRSAEV
ncbi:MAG: ABC transporter permease [Candidatus Sumerlaeota bacterium]|nr:ABC transporter permease [Candidatus Sumerlaeota bacterium]